MTVTSIAPTPAAAPVREPGFEPAERSRLGDLWRDSMVYAGRNIAHIREIPEKLLDVTIQPIMFVLLFAFVFGGAIAVDGSNYREYLIGGILIQSLAFGMMGPATAIATDLQEGVIDRFRSLPASRVAYLIGHYWAELAGLSLSIVILMGAGLVVGWRVHSGPIMFLAAVVLLLLFASAMIWIGTSIGLSVRTPDAVMGVGFMVVFPLTFVSNAFVPLESMPAVLQTIAAWNPISAIVAAVRELFGNPTPPLTTTAWPLEHPVVAAFGYCLLMLAIAVPFAVRKYRLRTSD
jgi:ABC-2 type transport system permease protein